MIDPNFAVQQQLTLEAELTALREISEKELLEWEADLTGWADHETHFVDLLSVGQLRALIAAYRNWEESQRICRYVLGIDKPYPTPGTCKVCGEPIRERRPDVVYEEKPDGE